MAPKRLLSSCVGLANTIAKDGVEILGIVESLGLCVEGGRDVTFLIRVVD